MTPEISTIEAELGKFPAAVLAEFRGALPHASQRLSEQDLLTWAQEGITLAHASIRSWEAALEYFKATPRVLEHLDISHVLNWASWGQRLSEHSPAISCAYFQVSPEAVTLLPSHRIGDWAELGRSLYKGSWKSGAMACQFFQTSPRFLRYLSLREARQFVLLVDSLSERSYELASECLALGETVFAGIEKEDRSLFLDFASVLAQNNHMDIRPFFSGGSKVLGRIDRSERYRFLSLAERMIRLSNRQTLPFLFDGSQALGRLDWDWHSHVLRLSEKLFAYSGAAAFEFLKSCPVVVDKIGFTGLDRWFEDGLAIVIGNLDGGIAYFSRDSSKSQDVLERLCSRVELGKVRDVLHMYCRAITGRESQVVSTEQTKEQGTGWTTLERPTTEGTQIYLPPFVEKYDSRDLNFAWLKVAATHQAAHLEYGSFDFSWERPAQKFPNLRHRQPAPQGRVDMQRFFNLFQDRRLAYDIFTAVEDSRVDWLLKHEYAGIRPIYQRAQEDALTGRRALRTLPLRESLLEVLTLMSLKQTSAADFPTVLRPYFKAASAIMRRLWASGTQVEDTAEATIRLYRIISRLPNRLLAASEWDGGAGDGESPDGKWDASLQPMPGQPGEELPYSQAQPVEFRGDFKPELVQMLLKLRSAPSNDKRQAAPISQEDLQRLLEKALDLQDLAPGDVDQDSGLFATDLPDHAEGTYVDPKDSEPAAKASSGRTQIAPLPDDHTFFYDEWDYRACDYRPHWCRVHEKSMNDGDAHFFDETMSKYHRLAAEIRRQFEQATPEMFKKIKRLEDGEEFDLDAVIEAMVERKTGNTPTDKVYWKRNKLERDVSVAFLLDMSASTAEAVESSNASPGNWGFDGDPRQYFNWLKSQAKEQANKKYRRIIDVEKESAVLLVNALETIGDSYGLFGFSGYGRDNVEFYSIKDLDEALSDEVKRRIDGINPLHATRMGPAIRHVTWRLQKHAAKTRILFLISDGRPQDHGYGQDTMEKDYAIHDTKMALAEAKRKGIVPFCLTVDKGGQDYLKKMCGDIGYEVVADIESLPRRLPLLYRRLTT